VATPIALAFAAHAFSPDGLDPPREDGGRGCPGSRRSLSGGPPASSARGASVTGVNQVREDRRNRREEGTPASQVVSTLGSSECPLPGPIQEALGELVGSAREGLLALSVGVGLGVVHELMELEVDQVVGPRCKHDLDRVAVRHGHEDGSMTLGGRRVGVRRPRIRTADGQHELRVST